MNTYLTRGSNGWTLSVYEEFTLLSNTTYKTQKEALVARKALYEAHPNRTSVMRKLVLAALADVGLRPEWYVQQIRDRLVNSRKLKMRVHLGVGGSAAEQKVALASFDWEQLRWLVREAIKEPNAVIDGGFRNNDAYFDVVVTYDFGIPYI